MLMYSKFRVYYYFSLIIISELFWKRLRRQSRYLWYSGDFIFIRRYQQMVDSGMCE